MGALKQKFSEEIRRGEHIDDMIDADFRHQQWEEEQREKVELADIEQRAEEAEFFNIFNLTGTYPM